MPVTSYCCIGRRVAVAWLLGIILWISPGPIYRSHVVLPAGLEATVRGQSLPSRKVSNIPSQAVNRTYAGTLLDLSVTYPQADQMRVYLRFIHPLPDGARIGVCLYNPNQRVVNLRSQALDRIVGLGISSELVLMRVKHTDGVSWQGQLYQAIGRERWKRIGPLSISQANTGELSANLPLQLLGTVHGGDQLRYKVGLKAGQVTKVFPIDRLLKTRIPLEYDVHWLWQANDPPFDDTGPGYYQYPVEKLYPPGSLDLLRFRIGTSPKSLVYELTFRELSNPWGSPIGVSHQAIDIYIDRDRQPGGGERLLLRGRHATVAAEEAWDAVTRIEMDIRESLFPRRTWWGRRTYIRAEQEPLVFTIPERRQIIIMVPKDVLLGTDPMEWGYLLTIAGQDGIHGISRIRRVVSNQTAKAHKEHPYFSGAKDDLGVHPNLIDILTPAERSQQQILNGFNHQARLRSPDQEGNLLDLAVLPMLYPRSHSHAVPR